MATVKPKNKYLFHCVVPNCPGKDKLGIQLFKVPKHDIDSWCKNLQIAPQKVKTTTRVCSRHFEPSWIGALKLKAGARPTLNLCHNDIDLNHSTRKPRFNPRKCHMLGCNNTAPPNTLFSFPTDEERLQKWLKKCVLKSSAKGKKHQYICENHFEKYMMPNKRLIPTAVPNMPDLESNLDCIVIPHSNESLRNNEQQQQNEEFCKNLLQSAAKDKMQNNIYANPTASAVPYIPVLGSDIECILITDSNQSSINNQQQQNEEFCKSLLQSAAKDEEQHNICEKPTASAVPNEPDLNKGIDCVLTPFLNESSVDNEQQQPERECCENLLQNTAKAKKRKKLLKRLMTTNKRPSASTAPNMLGLDSVIDCVLKAYSMKSSTNNEQQDAQFCDNCYKLCRSEAIYRKRNFMLKRRLKRMTNRHLRERNVLKRQFKLLNTIWNDHLKITMADFMKTGKTNSETAESSDGLKSESYEVETILPD